MKVKFLGTRVPGARKGTMKTLNEITLRGIEFKKDSVKDLNKVKGLEPMDAEALFAKVAALDYFEVV